MKKFMGMAAVAVFALAMTLNTNLQSNSESKLNLASLATLNTANAEYVEGAFGDYKYVKRVDNWSISAEAGGASASYGGSVEYWTWACIGYWGWCW